MQPLALSTPDIRVEIRLFGGFEVYRDGEPLGGFESQSARALLAYLACHPDQQIPREVLTELLWPESDSSTARHNLRQALYNLRGALAKAGLESPPVVSTFRTLAFERKPQVWVDVQECSVALQRARSGANLDPNHLAKGVELYRGDLLAGFYVRDSPAFEEWLLSEQGRLRDEVVHALRSLVENHLELGSYSLGVQYARQLLRIDRLSEEAHRQLMLLYARAGRRSRALAHFEELETLLDRELGVAPSEETALIYEQLRQEGVTTSEPAQVAERNHPVVPLVERETALSQLGAIWSRVAAGEGSLTLVAGEAGTGKTRLLRAFLNGISTTCEVRVLQGPSPTDGPHQPYTPFVEAVRNAVTYESESAERLFAAAGQTNLAALATLVPTLRQLHPSLTSGDSRRPTVSRQALFPAVARFLELLAERGRLGAGTVPLVLFFDDLHAADLDTFDLLSFLLPFLSRRPIWILGAFDPGALSLGHPLRSLADRYAGRTPIHLLALDPLSPRGLHTIARSLLDGAPADDLAAWLVDRSAGHPLMATELVNGLWSDGRLQPLAEGRWSLSANAAELHQTPRWTTTEIIRRRLDRLPSSARRLLTLAATLGDIFDTRVLQTIEHEHDRVLDTACEVLTQHWLIHPFAHYWADSRQARDRAVFAAGTQQRTYEVAHAAVRQAVCEPLGDDRLQYLHRRIAEALHPEGLVGSRELRGRLARHYRLAGDPVRALVALERAADDALEIEGFATAHHHLATARELLTTGGPALPSEVRRAAEARLTTRLAAVTPR